MLHPFDTCLLAVHCKLYNDHVPSLQYVTHFPKEEKYVSILRQVRLALLLHIHVHDHI